MQDLSKEVMHASKIARGERTLSQHIDRLVEVVGSTKDVKNLMQKIPQMKAKNKAIDRDFNANQGKVTMMEAKMCNLEKLIKKMVDNVSTLPKKLDMDKGHDSPQAVDSQGPNKHIGAYSKKTDDTGKKDEVKAMAKNMQILVDHALDLIKATQLFLYCLLCCLFVVLVLSLYYFFQQFCL